MNRKLLLLCVIVPLVCCSNNGEDEVSPPAEFTQAVVEGDNIKVAPLRYDIPFRNPMMGLRDIFSPGLDPVPASWPLPYGSVYREFIPWNSIENVESDGVDKIKAFCDRRWAGVEKKNVKVIPRVYIHWLGTPAVSDPDRLDGVRFPSDIPYTYDPKDPYPLTGGYFHPTFQDRVKKLVKKLGEAWDNDPRVAYVEMGLIGQWSEHHSPNISTFWPPHDFPEHVENVTWIPGIEKTLGDAFTEAFQNKKVMVRYAYEFKNYQFGFDWDSWAVEQEDVRGYQAMMDMGDRWKTHPYGGEICWNWGDFYAKFWTTGLPGILNDATARGKVIKYIRDLHANHLGYYSYARPTVDYADPAYANARLLQEALGYKFVLTEFVYSKKIEKGTRFNVSFKVRNDGSSPFYYDWPVEIALLDKNTKKPVWRSILTDLKVNTWYPGENWSVEANRYTKEPKTFSFTKSFTLGNEVPDGEYIISIAVLDPAGNKPCLRLATKQYFTGGRHPMGYVGVGKEASQYAINTAEFGNIFTDTTLEYDLQ